MGSFESLSVVPKGYCTASILVLAYRLVVYVVNTFTLRSDIYIIL